MSNFFNKSDLTRQDADKIVSDTLNNCDDGELYLEESKSESILLDDNKIKSSNYSSDLGFGFRAISNEVVAYSYSNEISKDSLKNSSENLKSTLKSIKGTYNHEIPKYTKIIYVSKRNYSQYFNAVHFFSNQSYIGRFYGSYSNNDIKDFEQLWITPLKTKA